MPHGVGSSCRRGSTSWVPSAPARFFQRVPRGWAWTFTGWNRNGGRASRTPRPREWSTNAPGTSTAFRHPRPTTFEAPVRRARGERPRRGKQPAPAAREAEAQRQGSSVPPPSVVGSHPVRYLFWVQVVRFAGVRSRKPPCQRISGREGSGSSSLAPFTGVRGPGFLKVAWFPFRMEFPSGDSGVGFS